MGSKCPSEASKAAGNVANLDCSGEIWEGNTQQSTMLPTERGDSSVRLQFFQRRSLAAVISCISAGEVLVFNPIMERTNCHERLMYHSSAVAADHFCKNNMQTPDQLAMHLMNHLRKELKGLKQKKFWCFTISKLTKTSHYIQFKVLGKGIAKVCPKLWQQNGWGGTGWRVLSLTAK